MWNVELGPFRCWSFKFAICQCPNVFCWFKATEPSCRQMQVEIGSFPWIKNNGNSWCAGAGGAGGGLSFGRAWQLLFWYLSCNQRTGGLERFTTSQTWNEPGIPMASSGILGLHFHGIPGGFLWVSPTSRFHDFHGCRLVLHPPQVGCYIMRPPVQWEPKIWVTFEGPYDRPSFSIIHEMAYSDYSASLFFWLWWVSSWSSQ